MSEKPLSANQIEIIAKAIAQWQAPGSWECISDDLKNAHCRLARAIAEALQTETAGPADAREEGEEKMSERCLTCKREIEGTPYNSETWVGAWCSKKCQEEFDLWRLGDWSGPHPFGSPDTAPLPAPEITGPALDWIS